LTRNSFGINYYYYAYVLNYYCKTRSFRKPDERKQFRTAKRIDNKYLFTYYTVRQFGFTRSTMFVQRGRHDRRSTITVHIYIYIYSLSWNLIYDFCFFCFSSHLCGEIPRYRSDRRAIHATLVFRPCSHPVASRFPGKIPEPNRSKGAKGRREPSTTLVRSSTRRPRGNLVLSRTAAARSKFRERANLSFLTGVTVRYVRTEGWYAVVLGNGRKRERRNDVVVTRASRYCKRVWAYGFKKRKP